MLLTINIYLLGLFCLLEVHSLTDESNNGDSPVIRISTGLICGRKAKTVSQKKIYYAFQGIPYAEPPIGDLRFKAPEKKSKWQKILNTTQDKSQCLQPGLSYEGSEDCLYLNVYTPKIGLHIKHLPVMVWIYGGGFWSGNSSYQSFGPDYLLEQDVVFVSMNYRLGIFGFGSTEDDVCPGNFGIKDQILALQWVQENIALFGGDRKKVTIFGQSAGSVSVSYILQTNQARNLFRAAIMQSGTSLCLWSLDRRAKRSMVEVGKALKINTTTSYSLIEGLKKIDATTLQNAAFPVALKETINDLDLGLSFGPVKEKGFIERYSEEALAQGKFQRVPILMGFTSQEAVSAANFTTIIRTYFEKFYNNSDLVPPSLTHNKTKALEAASEIKSYYFSNLSHREQKKVVQFLSDHLFNRPIERTVVDHSRYVPVFFYQFSYQGLLGSSDNRTVRGAGHAEDLNYLFTRNVSFALPTNDKLTRTRMVKLWTNFAKFLNPTPEKSALFDDVVWLQSNVVPDNRLYLNIDTDLELKLNPFNKNMRFWQKIFNIFGDPPYDTY